MIAQVFRTMRRLESSSSRLDPSSQLLIFDNTVQLADVERDQVLTGVRCLSGARIGFQNNITILSTAMVFYSVESIMEGLEITSAREHFLNSNTTRQLEALRVW